MAHDHSNHSPFGPCFPEVFRRLQQKAIEETASIYEGWTNEMKDGQFKEFSGAKCVLIQRSSFSKDLKGVC